jgi:hypothetical protein
MYLILFMRRPKQKPHLGRGFSRACSWLFLGYETFFLLPHFLHFLQMLLRAEL